MQRDASLKMTLGHLRSQFVCRTIQISSELEILVSKHAIGLEEVFKFSDFDVPHVIKVQESQW